MAWLLPLTRKFRLEICEIAYDNCTFVRYTDGILMFDHESGGQRMRRQVEAVQISGVVFPPPPEDDESYFEIPTGPSNEED